VSSVWTAQPPNPTPRLERAGNGTTIEVEGVSGNSARLSSTSELRSAAGAPLNGVRSPGEVGGDPRGGVAIFQF
jgi:hypothetical protein